jgi:peptide/nickel transport system permease protein
MSEGRRDAQRARRVAWALVPALVLVLFSAGVALGWPERPDRFVLELGWAAPSAARPLGSGEGGVDLLALTAHATLRALALALAVSLFGFVVGTPLGAWAGLAGGRFEQAVLRVCDLVQAFPTFLLALAVLSAVPEPDRLTIGGVFALTAWAQFARISAAQSRILRDAQFVEAAGALGAPKHRVVFFHIVPNLLGPVAVQLGTAAAGVVLGETALGFVGLGPPDGVSLGALLEQGTLGMLRAPHVLAVGGVAVALVSGSLQLASEGLRRWVHVA